MPCHVVFDGEQQILRARLRKCRQAAIARLPDLIERILARQVHDVDRNARHLRHRNRAMHRLGLGHGGPRQRVIDRRRLALGQRLLNNDIDYRSVFRMHADQRAILRRLPHAP